MTHRKAARSYIGAGFGQALTRVGPLVALASAGCLERPVAPAEPTTTNVFVGTIANQSVDKVDMLFMIDNSLSMADKQEILAQAVPVLVRRLATPSCVDASGKHTGVSDQMGHCENGHPEFNSVKDIHVGVITSSLGSHGGTECVPAPEDATQGTTPDDRGELLPKANPAVRGPIESWNDSGFLAWDPIGTRNTPPGDGNLDHLTQDFRDQVKKAGEHGCGYEGSLEAWYRFLIDPEPPTDVTSVAPAPGAAALAVRGPANQALLAERQAFLRPDSLLAIVMLTDENDCSIVDDDGQQGFLTSTPGFQMPRASAACAADPDDRCCHTCAVEAEPGCTPNESDAQCSKATPPNYQVLKPTEDQPNLRCFDQKRRFGMDLLYPVARYVDGLTQPNVRNRAGKLVPNPIFQAPPGMPARGKDLVLLTGIVGVPWQDIASDDSLKGDSLRYLTVDELDKSGRWDMILGGKDGPSDPFMRESVTPRSGQNPVTGDAIVPPNAGGRKNAINGHEQDVKGVDDLQYACTFPLAGPRPCTEENGQSCDCTDRTGAYDSSLCSYPNGPQEMGTQIAAKAYPGLRELAVLKGVGDNGIVASICPKNTMPAAGMMPEEDPSYGYNPAIAAMAEIFKQRFQHQCLPRPLPVESDPAAADFGKVPCAVVEAMPENGAACGCDTGHGRSDFSATDANLRNAVREELRQEGRCDAGTGPKCNDFCLCKLDALTGPALDACQNGHENSSMFGYCYVDPAQGIGDPALVADCPAQNRRSLRFVGEGVPANGSITFMACQGAAVSDMGMQ